MTSSIFDDIRLCYNIILPAEAVLEECDTFCFGEEHDSSDGRKLKEKYIQQLASPGDIVLVEGVESLSEVVAANPFFPFSDKEIVSLLGLEIYGWDIKDYSRIYAAEREVFMVAVKIHELHRTLLDKYKTIDDLLDWETLFFSILEGTMESESSRIFIDFNSLIKHFHSYAERLTKFDQAHQIPDIASRFAVNLEKFQATDVPAEEDLYRKELQKLQGQLGMALQARADFLALLEKGMSSLVKSFPMRTISMVNTLSSLDSLSSTAQKCFVVAGAGHFKEGLKYRSPEERPFFSLKFFHDYMTTSPRKIAILIPKEL